MKKKLSAITALLLAIVLTFSLGACKKETSEDELRSTIDQAMKAFVKFDQKELEEHVESSVMDTITAHLDLIPNGDKIVAGLLDGMTYEIGDITIDENPQGVDKKVSATAKAKLKITAKDLKKEGATYQLKVYAGASSGSMDLTDQNFLKEEANRILEVINAEDVPMVETAMTLELEKRSGKWVVILSGAPQNAMFGGAGSALNQVISYVYRAQEGAQQKKGA